MSTHKISIDGEYKRQKAASDAVCVVDTQCYMRSEGPHVPKNDARIFPGRTVHANRGNFLVRLVNINNA